MSTAVVSFNFLSHNINASLIIVACIMLLNPIKRCESETEVLCLQCDVICLGFATETTMSSPRSVCSPFYPVLLCLPMSLT